MTRREVRLVGAVGPAGLPEEEGQRRPSVEVSAVGSTYEEALARLRTDVPEGRLLLWIRRDDADHG